MSETLSLPLDAPAFGEGPQPADWQPPYPVTLGPLFDALSIYVPDGIDAVNTYFDHGLAAPEVKALYEELILSGACEDPRSLASDTLDPEARARHEEAFAGFLGATAYMPVFDAEPIAADSLEGYSRSYLLRSVQPPPTETGMQLGTTGKVITTGPNRFNPRSPKKFTITEVTTNPNTGRKRRVTKPVELASSFYWDAEPSAEELLAMKQSEDVLSVLDSFAGATERFGGCILNWNNKAIRRSQLALFFRMVDHAATYMPERSDEILSRYLRPMMLHINFLRDGMDRLGEAPGSTDRRVGRLPDGEIGLHNYDDFHDHTQPGNPIALCDPRLEMADHDLTELKKYEARLGITLSPEERCDFLLGFGASAESSFDHSKDQMDEDGRLIGHRLINPAQNAVYAQGLLIAAKAWRASARLRNDPTYSLHAENQAMQLETEYGEIVHVLLKYNYNPEDKMFGMYDFVKAAKEGSIDAGRRRAWSLNGVYVLTAIDLETNLASEILDGIDQNFLREGGLLAASRYFESEEQWDGRASWPIWVRECIKAAIKYKRLDLAEKWLTIHTESYELLFAKTGRLGEKHSAITRGVALKIGEYEDVDVEDLTMSHSSYLWMKRMLRQIRAQRVAQAVPLSPLAAITDQTPMQRVNGHAHSPTTAATR